MPELEIDEHGLEALAWGVRTLSEQAYRLGPVGYRVRDRVLESERRLFRESPWPNPKPSTIRRYRWPIANMADEQDHLAAGSGPLDRIGLGRRTLTTPHAPGQRDSIQQSHGGLTVAWGIQARGRVSYMGMQQQGSGGRLARNPFRFDPIAHADASGDVVEHILEHFGE